MQGAMVGACLLATVHCTDTVGAPCPCTPSWDARAPTVACPGPSFLADWQARQAGREAGLAGCLLAKYTVFGHSDPPGGVRGPHLDPPRGQMCGETPHTPRPLADF